MRKGWYDVMRSHSTRYVCIHTQKIEKYKFCQALRLPTPFSTRTDLRKKRKLQTAPNFAIFRFCKFGQVKLIAKFVNRLRIMILLKGHCPVSWVTMWGGGGRLEKVNSPFTIRWSERLALSVSNFCSHVWACCCCQNELICIWAPNLYWFPRNKLPVYVYFLRDYGDFWWLDSVLLTVQRLNFQIHLNFGVNATAHFGVTLVFEMIHTSATSGNVSNEPSDEEMGAYAVFDTFKYHAYP